MMFQKAMLTSRAHMSLSVGSDDQGDVSPFRRDGRREQHQAVIAAAKISGGQWRQGKPSPQ